MWIHSISLKMNMTLSTLCFISLFFRKPNSYLLVCEKREKQEEEERRVYLVKQQLAEVTFILYSSL